MVCVQRAHRGGVLFCLLSLHGSTGMVLSFEGAFLLFNVLIAVASCSLAQPLRVDWYGGAQLRGCFFCGQRAHRDGALGTVVSFIYGVVLSW